MKVLTGARSVAVGALLALMLPAPAFAQYSSQMDGASLHAGELEVPINKSQVVTADRSIAKALVGNADIADVLPISGRSVYVLGKKLGTTSLTLYDTGGRVIAIMDVAVGPDVESLRRQIAQLIPGQDIEARISNGSILLSGMVSDPGAVDRAMQLAKAFAGDNVINLMTVGGSQQVMLEVKFAEVNRQMGEKLGLDYGFSDNGSFGGVIGEGAAQSGAGAATLGAISDSFGIFGKSFSIGSTSINATLNMLERHGLAKTLAEPTLIALSGERASFLAGGEFPIPVLQGSSGGTGTNNNAITIQFKPFGVSLGFTPTVLGDKVISLVVEPEVSSIDPSASVTVNGLVVPGLQTRRASTTVELRDGESFAIAGLIRRDFQTTVRQLPILGSIPIIGSLFRSSSFQKGETELLIIVTPRLVAPIKPEQVRLPTDQIEDPKAVDVLIDGEGYKPKALPPQPNAPMADPAGAAAAAPAATGGTAPDAAAKKDPGYEY
ncbi:type II and III secretion system protein family protein [Novosphingobium sp. ZN18A2]|uniref:type II and III secretion system protein family protein n=1 Tax=Novosphingobium sp. ZN18A2 TaxID=3079861 RepID=UPI0030D36008